MNIFVPRIVDRHNHNAQNINAKAMLSHWNGLECKFTAVHFSEVDDSLRHHDLRHLSNGRFWRMDLFRNYLKATDAVFYPGVHWFDHYALRLKAVLNKKPVIGTLEGIPWMPDDVRKKIEKSVGHEIIPMSKEATAYYNRVLAQCDHIIAISPFLATVARHLFKKNVSVIPLGIERQVFYSDVTANKKGAVTIVCSGTVYERKRPELFVELAKRMPQAKFVWYGGGPLLEKMRERAKKECHGNLEFAGPVDHHRLADAFRAADLFVLPSLSEGVPKVSQEAAACGLPLVLFGHYEAPSLVDGENGVVVWSDDELINTVADLVKDRERLSAMGRRSAEMAKAWDWVLLAPQWLKQIKSIIETERQR